MPRPTGKAQDQVLYTPDEQIVHDESIQYMKMHEWPDMTRKKLYERLDVPAGSKRRRHFLSMLQKGSKRGSFVQPRGSFGPLEYTKKGGNTILADPVRDERRPATATKDAPVFAPMSMGQLLRSFKGLQVVEVATQPTDSFVCVVQVNRDVFSLIQEHQSRS